MAKSTSESGHIKNLTTFNEVIAFVKTYKDYNPSNPALAPGGLSEKLQAADKVLSEVNARAAILNETIRTRMLAFETIVQTGTSIVAMLDASGANKEMLKDAKGLNRKLRGSRAKKTEVVAAPAEGLTAEDAIPKNISVSQQSYDRKADNLGLLRDLVAMYPGYKPNEAELSVEGLTSHVDELKALNERVATEYAEVTAKRNERDVVFYDKVTGLVEVFNGVKKYVLGKYKNKSPEYKQLTNLTITVIKKWQGKRKNKVQVKK